MEHKCALGIELKTLANLLRRMMEQDPAFQELAEVTPVQAAIIEYLYENSHQDIFQRDLEAEFQIRRSTVTGILQGMERKGLIQRQAVAHDARLKKLILTEHSCALQEHIENSFAEIEKQAMTGITEEECAFFYEILEKMKKNLL